MTAFTRSLALAAALVAGGASFAAAQTLGERVQTGAMSQSAFDQLIAHTGLNAEEASSKTVNEIFYLRATHD